MQGQNERGYGGEAVKICYFTGQKGQYSVFLQGNLLNPKPTDKLLLPERKLQKIFTGLTSDTPQRNILTQRP